MSIFDLWQLAAERKETGRPYLEFLRRPAFSVGIYELAVDAIDTQRPHTEDEIYCVVAGCGIIRIGAEDVPVSVGSVVFVPAQQEHHFHSITMDLTLLVVFAPAEGTHG